MTWGESNKIMEAARKMHCVGEVHGARVMKREFAFWADFNMRCTYAMDRETGEIKPISGSGYIHADRTVRKAIAAQWNLPRFSEK